nr:TetR/AcrR family transcriptional regulator [Paenibacillus xylanexedens]
MDDQRTKTRRIMVFQLIHRARKEKLTSLRAEDMAKCMDVSKVTMYKYFTSKEDILSSIVDIISDYLRNEDIFKMNEDDSLLVRYQKSFEQSLMIHFYFPEQFFEDFKLNHPDLYEKIVDAQHFRFQQLEKMYQQGEESGVFNRVNAAIFVLNDEMILRRLLDPSYLIRHGLLLENALRDYYEMQKRTLFTDKSLQTVDDTPVHELIQFFVTKNSRFL